MLRDATNWDEVLSRLGYEHLRRHDLRHAGLTWMAEPVVEVSYDEGRTWWKATVRAGAVAVVNHPAGATSVSLRASATDRDGNTVKQTIIRAYKLR